MSTDLELMYANALMSLQAANTADDLEAWYRQNLGRKGQVYLLTRQVGQLDDFRDLLRCFGPHHGVGHFVMHAGIEAVHIEIGFGRPDAILAHDFADPRDAVGPGAFFNDIHGLLRFRSMKNDLYSI